MSNWNRALSWVFCAGLAFGASACDKGGDAGKCGKGTAVEVGGNHGHTADVPVDAIKRGMGGAYAVKGGEHQHAIALSDEETKKLQAGQPVSTRTSSVNAHLHEVTISCKP